MTFSEINDLTISQNIKNIIKSIYFKEYMKDFDDNDQIREQIIIDIKKIIK